MTAPRPVRAFVAVYPPPPVRAALASALEAVAREPAAAGLRLADAAHLHLTVAFLGEQPASDLDAFATDLEALAIPPISLGAAGLGCFPSRGRPRVLWAGVDGDLDALRGLAAAVARIAATHGVPPEERPFRPHWTLGRARRHARLDAFALRELCSSVPAAAAPAPIDGLALVASELGPAGARHTVLRRYR